MNIAKLKEEESKLLELLAKNKDKQRRLNLIQFIEDNGVNIGDIVEYEAKFGIVTAIITDLYFKGNKILYGSEVSGYKAKLFDKNGEIKKGEYEIYEHHMKTLKVIQKIQEH